MDVDEKIIDAVHEFPAYGRLVVRPIRMLLQKAMRGRRYLTRYTNKVFLFGMLKMLLHILGESNSRGVSKKVAVVKE